MYRRDRNNNNSNFRRNLSPMLIMLGMRLYQELDKIPNKPPVTIALLALNIIPHIYRVNIFGFDLSNIQENCINPRVIVNSLFRKNSHRGMSLFYSDYDNNSALQLNRIILPAFMHADDTHLYYNMISLCWKGINLERELGSVEFLQLVVFSLLASHIILVISSYVLFHYMLFDNISGYNNCAVGFSAVLFSLKYVWNYLSPSDGYIMGFHVPSKYVAWAELVAISIISPNASFIGHLSGILAGIIYIHVIRKLVNIRLNRNYNNETNSNRQSGSRYTYASGYSGTNNNYGTNSYSYENIRNQRNSRFSNNRY